MAAARDVFINDWGVTFDPHIDHPGRHNPAMELEYGARLRSLGFQPGPAYSCGADGVYYCFASQDAPEDAGDAPHQPPICRSDIQLIVVGPMGSTPFGYAQTVGAALGRARVVAKIGTLDGEQGFEKITRDRGFWSILLRDERVAWAAKQRAAS